MPVLKESFDHISDDTLVKFLLGETNEEETLEVQAWLDADPANRQRLQDYQVIWEESRKLLPELRTDEDMAWQRFQVRVKYGAKKPDAATVKRMPFLRVAAAVIIIAGAALAALFLIQDRKVEYITQVAQEKVLRDSLPDGSIVTLNKHSRITYPDKFSGKARNIKMEGEAFFNVAADKNHPFVIQVNDVTIKVVGTSFNVRDIDGKTEVIVESGIVEVTGKSVSVRLHPEEKVVVGEKDSAVVKEKVAGKLYNYYASKEFVCDRTPLWKLVEILNKAYDANIVIGRKEIRDLPLTTTFDNESLDNILNIISQTFNIRVTKEEGSIVLE